MPYTVKKTFEQVAAAGAHVIAQVKANQPTLHQRVAELCQRTAPLDQTRTADQKRRSRDEIRVVEVFAPGPSLADTEWADHVAAVVRVSRDTLKRVTRLPRHAQARHPSPATRSSASPVSRDTLKRV